MFDIKKLTDEVNKETCDDDFQKAKKTLIAKRKELNVARRVVKRIEAEERDLLAEIEQGL